MRRPVAAITGGTGFIGRHVARTLAAQGWNLKLLVRPACGRPNPERPCEVIPGDLHDTGALRALVRGADAVIHIAGCIKATSRDGYFRANAEGSAHLGRIVREEVAGTRLVVVSSLAAREPQLSAYAASKRAGEEAAVAACGAARAVVLRPTAVYGPGDRESLLVFRAARSLLAVPAIDSRITLLHVEDLAHAIAALAAAPSITGTYELTDDRRAGYSWDEIAQAATAALGVTPRIVKVPPLVLRLAAPLLGLTRLGGRPPMLTADKLREILHGDWSSSAAAQPPLAIWQPRIALSSGFSQTARWYVENGWMSPVARAG